MDHILGKKSIELIGEECGDSPKQVQRYIKITDLIPEIAGTQEIEIGRIHSFPNLRVWAPERCFVFTEWNF